MKSKTKDNSSLLIGIRRKLLITAVSITIAFSLVAIGTYAWEKVNSTKDNDLRNANLEAEITEQYTPPENVDPDEIYVKKVQVTNTSNQPELLRVMVYPTITASDGETKLVTDSSLILSALNTTYWTDGGDGYYYYNSYLDDGKTTEPVLDTVKLSSSVANTYDGATIEIMIVSEATEISPALTYRTSWWGGVTPTENPLLGIDNVMQAIVAAKGAN